MRMSLPYRRRGEVTGETHVGDFGVSAFLGEWLR